MVTEDTGLPKPRVGCFGFFPFYIGILTGLADTKGETRGSSAQVDFLVVRQ